MAAVMKNDRNRQVLGELQATRQIQATRAEFRVERLQELRAVIASIRWESRASDSGVTASDPALTAVSPHTR